jgi:hypothetical protein
MIDRDLENATFTALSDAAVGPPYFGRFGNGRVEGWLEGSKDLTLAQMGQPELSAKIAAEMAKLHGFRVSIKAPAGALHAPSLHAPSLHAPSLHAPSLHAPSLHAPRHCGCPPPGPPRAAAVLRAAGHVGPGGRRALPNTH